ncbi:MAG: hypothetical protein JXR37_26785 [Kiritimatiellae bacterium]|nr:hypothetical protein [Kiritimatiellia bacterium]
MNKRENFLALLHGERPHHVPRKASFTPDLKRRMVEYAGTEDLTSFFDMDGYSGVARTKPGGVQRPDFARYYPELEDHSCIDGIGVARVPGGLFHFRHVVSPLRNAETLAEIEAFPIDEEDWPLNGLPQKVAAQKAAGRVVAGGIGHMYEDAWQIRDNQRFLEDLYLNPSFVDSILDRLMRRNLNRAVAYAEAGADVLTTGDDVANQNAMMFSPELWRRHLKSRWAKVYAAARAIKPDIAIHYHSDGNIKDIIPELIQIGVTILNPVQPECVDPRAVREAFGDALILDGTIGTQSTFPFGTPAEMAATVKRRIEQVGRSGGLILAPTHVLEPDVPIGNICAFFDACREYGTY